MKMTDTDIVPIQRLDFLVSPLPWSFAADRLAEIEDYFTHLRRAKPQLWNGRVLLLRDFEIADATLQGTLFETDYASFIAWRDWGFPDRDVRACFAMGALLSGDCVRVGRHECPYRRCRRDLLSLRHARPARCCLRPCRLRS